MSEATRVETDVLAWLDEIGVPGAGPSTRISSLNLAWIVHRFEQSRSVSVDIADDDLQRIVDVDGLVTVLSAADEADAS